MSFLMVGGSLLSIGGGLFGGSKARKRAKAAAEEAARREREVEALESSRQSLINPYDNQSNLSDLAKDLSGMMTNPFSNLGVATNAAEMEIEQSDLALAATLDTLKATGASAGGATALAQAALKSKQGVSASIEKQEAANEQQRAQGEQRMNEQKIAEQQRLQSVQLSEGQRIQAGESAGRQFKFGAAETREQSKIDRKAGLADRARAQEAQAQADESAATAGMFSGLGNIFAAGLSG